MPIDDELQALIGDQQNRARERWPDGTPVLFPRPTANIDGQRPVSYTSYRDALYRWLEDCDVRDEHGQPVHLTPHQWRHILSALCPCCHGRHRRASGPAACGIDHLFLAAAFRGTP